MNVPPPYLGEASPGICRRSTSSRHDSPPDQDRTAHSQVALFLVLTSDVVKNFVHDFRYDNPRFKCKGTAMQLEIVRDKDEALLYLRECIDDSLWCSDDKGCSKDEARKSY